MTPVEETLSAYAQLIAQGKVRAIGASNSRRRARRRRLPPRRRSASPATRACSRSTTARPRDLRTGLRADLRGGEHRRHPLLRPRGRLPVGKIPLRRRTPKKARRAAAKVKTYFDARARSPFSRRWTRSRQSTRRTPTHVSLAWLIGRKAWTAPIVSRHQPGRSLRR